MKKWLHDDICEVHNHTVCSALENGPLFATPKPLQKAVFAANHHSDFNLHLAIVLTEAAGKRKKNQHK